MLLKVIIFIIGVLVLVVMYETYKVVRMQHLAPLVIQESEPYAQSGVEETILVAGDSTGYGTGALDPRKSVAGRIGQAFPEATVRNISQNGYTLRALTRVLEDQRPADVVVLQIGGNDILQLRSEAQVRRDAAALLEVANRIGDRVIFMSTGDVGAAPGFGPVLSWFFTHRTLTVRDIFIEEAEAVGVTYVDLYESRKENQFSKDPKRYYSDDGLHPSGAGYGIWFEKLSEVL